MWQVFVTTPNIGDISEQLEDIVARTDSVGSASVSVSSTSSVGGAPLRFYTLGPFEESRDSVFAEGEVQNFLSGPRGRRLGLSRRNVNISRGAQ